ncbi:PEP-CTERM sorting domain-containing protein [Crocosphaera sp.]|uniref:PEP-CTERM sorting domain-containing protein n=1 Tax=Crocosphaera sp. TaxID=2729996 RepID=UPI0026052452|nr:PEP-CTERM sorting domain-containing protein [Crocosphaera sp.]MDJ0580934.1 PEP-CTERM sorting domain-containing protein [Crocosphaera sp.]
MNKIKKLAYLGASVPIALLSVLGSANDANAGGPFAPGDQFNGFWGLQLNGHSSGVGVCPFPASPDPLGANDQAGACTGSGAIDARRGLNNGAIDFIFSPTLPEGNGNATLNADNAILNFDETLGVDATIGNLALMIASGGSGGFSRLNAGDLGNVRNADGLNLPNGFTTGNNAPSDNSGLSFMDITADDGAQYIFSLKEVTFFELTDNDIGGVPTVDFDLEALGTVLKIDGDDVFEAHYALQSTGQGLGVGPAELDGVTDVSSVSFTITVVEKVPEPSSMLGLLALAGTGIFSGLKKQRK